MLRFYGLALAKYDRPFNAVLQLTDIPTPGMPYQHIHRLWRPVLDVLLHFSRVEGEKMLHEHRNVFTAFAQRRDDNREHVQSVEEISPE